LNNSASQPIDKPFMTMSAEIEYGSISDTFRKRVGRVAPFVDLLSAGGFQAEADVNLDGSVNLLDVGPFVELLAGQ
jgi:hypothetical protein